jgi:hypothetical protein
LSDPWRTREEYNQEQKTLLSAYRWSVAASLAAIITALCTIILASVAIFEIKGLSQEVQRKIAPKAQAEMPTIQSGQK